MAEEAILVQKEVVGNGMPSNKCKQNFESAQKANQGSSARLENLGSKSLTE